MFILFCRIINLVILYIKHNQLIKQNTQYKEKNLVQFTLIMLNKLKLNNKSALINKSSTCQYKTLYNSMPYLTFLSYAQSFIT